MLPYHRKLLNAAGGGGNTVRAVTFDGVNDYLNRGGALTSAANSQKGIISFWVKFNGGDGVAQEILRAVLSTGEIRVERQATNKFAFSIVGDLTGGVLNLTSLGTYTVSDGWLHVLASWDASQGDTWPTTTSGISHIYVNDSSDPDTNNCFDDSAKWADMTDLYLFAENGGSSKLNADIAEFYINSEEYLDLSVEANRRKFITAAGKPANLGADGSAPTGNDPIIYLKGPASGFNNNRGYGGNFTVNGSLTNATTSPN